MVNIARDFSQTIFKKTAAMFCPRFCLKYTRVFRFIESQVHNMNHYPVGIFTCSKLTIAILEQGVKYVQS